MQNRPRGRPRDARIDEQVLAATLHVLVEQGFDGTTIQAVARRSGMHTSAIYRRWKTRVELIEEAISPRLEQLDVEPTGELELDLRRLVQSLDDAFGTPAARAALPGLIATYQVGEGPRPAEEWLRHSLRPYLVAVLEAAPVGSVDPEVRPDELFDMILGMLLVRTYIPVPGQVPLGRIAELAARLVNP